MWAQGRGPTGWALLLPIPEILIIDLAQTLWAQCSCDPRPRFYPRVTLRCLRGKGRRPWVDQMAHQLPYELLPKAPHASVFSSTSLGGRPQIGT